MEELNQHFHQTDILKAGLAIVAGVLLGYERESKDKSAGLKTITIITVGFTKLQRKRRQFLDRGGDHQRYRFSQGRRYLQRGLHNPWVNYSGDNLGVSGDRDVDWIWGILHRRCILNHDHAYRSYHATGWKTHHTE